MPLLLAQLATIVLAAGALCLYAGWGAARLALPTALRPLGALFAPLVGYAIVIYIGYLGVSSALNLRGALALLLLLATGLNALAWLCGGRPHPLAALRAHWAPLALAGITLFIGVLPLLHYGYISTIGQGWDTESYLPLAQHLIDYPVSRIPSAPSSPLRDLVSHPPGIGVTLGFSVFQGLTMLLSGASALASFAPLLALLRALGILAIYAWLRTTMGLGRWAALLGAALASAGSLMLWIGYFNFGMQLSAWPLLALGLAVGVAAVEELAAPLRKSTQPPDTKPQESEYLSFLGGLASGGKLLAILLLAAIVLAALPVAYYPALTLWAPVAVGLGLARLLELLRRRPGEAGPLRLVLAALALGALVLLLAAPTVADYYQGFSFRYSLIAQHIGPDRFIAFAETLGLLAFRLPNDGPQPPAALVWIAVAIAGALGLAGLAVQPANATSIETRRHRDKERTQEQTISRSRNLLVSLSIAPRLRWLGLLLAALAYLIWLRFGRPYEYAYMKGSAYAGFLAWGLVALGAQALWQRAGSRARPAVLALALTPLLVAGWAQALTVGDHWRGSANFTRDMAAIEDAARLVPAGATVAISGDSAFTGLNSGLISSALYGREIWGHFSTAYSHLSYWPDGRMPQYAVLAAGERAWPLDLGGRELWRSAAAAIYQLDPQALALIGRSDLYSTVNANKFSPAALDIQRRGGAFRSAEPGAPLMLLLGDTLRFGPGQPVGGAGAQQLDLELASLAAQRVAISSNDTSAVFDLAAGVNRIRLPVRAPASVRIASEQSLALISATAHPASSSVTPNAVLDSNQAAWSASIEQIGPVIQLRVPIANPGHHALRIGLTLVEDTYDRSRTLVELLAAPLDGAWQLNVDPVRGATEALVGGKPTPLLQVKATPNAPDGSYFAVLTLYDGAQIVAHAPVFTFSISGGKLAALAPQPFTIEATPVGLPSAPLPGNQRDLLGRAGRELDGVAAELAGAVLARTPAWPGAPADAPIAPGSPISVQLYWQARAPASAPLMISVQALGADDRKWAQWDGALGGDWRPAQSWQAGDRIRQDVPLQLDSATPPGRYRLALVAYNPATGQAVPFGGENMVQLGELEVR